MRRESFSFAPLPIPPLRPRHPGGKFSLQALTLNDLQAHTDRRTKRKGVRGNRLHSNAAIGGSPQHLRYQDEPTGVEVGDGNTFRENVTVHRATAPSGRTRIGSGNYFLAGSHVGRDCQVGDHCTLADNGLLGGHCALAEGVYVGGNSAVHQFCRLGRLAVLEATSSATVVIAPFIVQRGRNVVVGVNAAGMRRAGLGEGQIRAMQRCYDTVYLRGLLLTNALD